MIDICGTTSPIGHRHELRVAGPVDARSAEALLAETLTDGIDVVLIPDPSEPSALVRLVD